MNSPDMHTLVFSFLLTDIIINLVIVKLWLDNRKHFSGTLYWVVDFTFQTVALLLIGLRGTIPDWLSMVVSNALVISGNIMGLIGLESFTGIRKTHYHNYILLALFIFVHFWFAIVEPDLPARNLNLASVFFLISLQFCWHVFFRIKGEMQKLTLNIGFIFIFYTLVNLGRIVNFFTASHPGNDYFIPNGFESSVLIIYQMLFILLTYSLALMFNKRLLINIDKSTSSLKESQALLQAAMDCSTAGIAIADAPDGKIRYINKAGLLIPSKSGNEILKDLDINKYVSIWNIKSIEGTPLKPDEVPLARAVLYGETNSREFIISRQNGDDRTVLANASPIFDDSGKVKAGIVVFQDITERKEAEELHQEKIQELEKFNKIMIGRENRMVELKQEINELCVKLKMPPRYRSAEVSGDRLNDTQQMTQSK